MPIYILDTGIVLGYCREAAYARYVDNTFAVSDPPNVTVVSIVTAGEMLSLALQLGWGKSKKANLKEIIDSLPLVSIDNPKILESYAKIDAYSQGKDALKALPDGISSRNMGKNDIWIAATASVLQARLVTTDQDFDHLNGVYLNVIYVDPNGIYPAT